MPALPHSQRALRDARSLDELTDCEAFDHFSLYARSRFFHHSVWVLAKQWNLYDILDGPGSRAGTACAATWRNGSSQR